MKFQKIYISALLLLFTAAYPLKSLKAQSEFGVKGGPIYTGFRDNYSGVSFDFESKNGVSIGAFYRLNNLIGPLHFQAEFLYQLKGARTYILYSGSGSGSYNNYEAYGYSPYSGYGGGYGGGYGYGYGGAYGYISPETSPYIRYKENYHYFNVPLLISVTTFKILDIYAGPELGYLFASSNNNRLLGELNRYSAGVATGIALKLGESTKLDLRYSTDFTTVYDMGSVNLKNQSFAFTVQRTLFRKQK
jgi:hypothetical protein